MAGLGWFLLGCATGLTIAYFRPNTITEDRLIAELEALAYG